MECRKCGEGNAVKNGFVRGKQRYFCKACSYNFVKDPKQKGIPEPIKGMAYTLYLEGMSFRGIERVLKISHVTVMKWIKSLPEALKQKEAPAGKKCIRVVEIDEMWHYIEKKKKTWL